VLRPGLTPSQVIALNQVAALVVSDATPALEASPEREADIILDLVQSMIAPYPASQLSAPARGHRFSTTPGQTHARLLRLAALSTAMADRIALSFDLAPSTPLPVAQRLEAAANIVALNTGLMLPCDTEPVA
jgi:hypothetical protein